tara:strand:+ start:2290 stop:2523 length:234 start_codon:yes stop_codon:yes gene_type:complete
VKEFDEDLCMRYTYNLLLGKKTIDQLIEEADQSFCVLIDPRRTYVKMQDDIYDTLIEYFTYTEEYEKCAELLKAKTC